MQINPGHSVIAPCAPCQEQRTSPLSYIHPCVEPLTLPNTRLEGLHIAPGLGYFFVCFSERSPFLVSLITLSEKIVIKMVNMVPDFSYVPMSIISLCLFHLSL